MAFEDFVAAVEAAPDVQLHGLVVFVDGRRVAERHWLPWAAEDRALVYSVSKTVTATAVGLAVAEGLFGLDDLVAELFAEDLPADADARVGELTVHHLLAMSTGHDADTLDSMLAAAPVDAARAFLGQAPQRDVGSLHTYNNGASWMLADLVRRRAGQSLVAYLQPRLFEPLAITPTWDADALGREFGFSGLHLRTADLAALGELYRTDGVLAGRQVLPVGWVDQVSARHIGTDGNAGEWAHGYGYQVWRSRAGYRLDGAYGQYALVLPEQRAVVAITSAQPDSQHLLDLVFERLVPELAHAGDAGHPNPGGADQLLSLAAPDDEGAPGPWRGTGTPAVDGDLAAWPAEAYAGDAERAGYQFSVPELSDLAVEREGPRVAHRLYRGRTRLDGVHPRPRLGADGAGVERVAAARVEPRPPRGALREVDARRGFRAQGPAQPQMKSASALMRAFFVLPPVIELTSSPPDQI